MYHEKFFIVFVVFFIEVYGRVRPTSLQRGNILSECRVWVEVDRALEKETHPRTEMYLKEKCQYIPALKLR